MRIAYVLVIVLALIFSPSFLEKAGLEEYLSSHHEHPGITDASADDPGHEHGDADDHHSSPDSPCHHHAVHCCCSHSHNILPMDLIGLGIPSVSRRISVPAVQMDIPPSLKSILHVPLA